MTMIERVAVAISGAPFPTKASLRKARAAIEAMREPTETMYDALWVTSKEEAATVWGKMIDAALNEDAK
jgi:hypothetical protein